MMGELHIVHIPYFVNSDDMTSILTLNNNMTEEASATVTLFNTKGEALVLPTIHLAPQLPVRFDLSQLANKPDFESGNVQIAFNGMSMGITSQVSVISTARRVAFESVEDEAMDFASSRLDGILWLPDPETQARLALTNTTASAVTATVSAAGRGEERGVTLGPHETELVEANSFVESAHGSGAPGVLVSIQHDASPGAVVVTGFAVNAETGFSTNFPFVDRTTSVSTKLAGAHVRAGLPNPGEGFPTGTRFSAPLILANAGALQSQAAVWLDYTIDSIPHRTQVGMATLAPGQIRQFDLANTLAAQGVPGPLDDAGVDVTYTGPPGTVIGRLTSFDQSGDFAFDVPIKDPLAGMARSGGSYPWRLDGGYNTVVHLKNTVNAEVHAIVQVRYKGGNYSPDRIKLEPFQTIAIDIGSLRNSQEGDIHGAVMPRDVESGQVLWYELTPGTLIGRAEVFNVGEGVASSFSCSTCPPSFSTPSMSPSSAILTVGASSRVFTPQETDVDCYSAQYGPYNASPTSWSSTNESVARVGSDGTVTSVGPGTATILASWPATIYQCGNFCNTQGTNATAAGSVTVVQVTFQKSDGTALPSPFKVGISANTIGNTDVGPQPHDRTQTILVVVTPPGEAASVTVSGPGLNVSTVSTDTTSGVITVKVVGKTKSAQRGDFSLYAHHTTAGNFPSNNGFPVTVVVPAAIAGPPNYQHDTTGTLIMQNMALNLTTGPVLNVDRDHVELATVYGRRLTITVLDQLGDPLGDLYKDAEVEENLFGTLVSINSPLSASGTYTDPVGFFITANPPNVVAKNDPAVAAWLDPKTALLPLAQDDFTENIAVSVDQFPLTPSVVGRRKIAAPPSSITIVWP